MRTTAFAAAFVVGGLLAGMAAAQTYPDKPIRLIVPFPPGGSADILARTLSESFRDSLKQPVIVDNLAGAGGAIGSIKALQERPDGYSLLIGT